MIFQLAEVAVPRRLAAEVLRRIDRLREPPLPAGDLIRADCTRGEAEGEPCGED